MDTFFNDYIGTYIQTIYSKLPDEPDEETVLHIPLMLGGFFSYSDAEEPFKYFDQLTTLFKQVDVDRYNIKIRTQYSTVD